MRAQEPHCGFDQVQKELMRQEPHYRAEIAAYQTDILPGLQFEQRSTANVLTIPVVVHVLHTGQSLGVGANLSEDRIISQIEVMNQDYRRINDDVNQTPDEYLSIAADTEIQFCLAKIGPEGKGTNGITRHVYTNINDIDDIENMIKPETIWDPTRYLNIWTIDMPSNSVLGYSYLPTTTMVGSDRDGVVIDHPRFGFQSSNDRGRTCVHEVGHYMGLQHPWGTNDSNGDPVGCDSDDGVEDTPASEAPYYACPSFGISSCGTVDMVMNYMEYVNDDCMNLFTQGQKNVMQGNLAGIRSDLVNNGLTACEEVEFGCISLTQTDFNMGFETTDSQNGWVVENTNGDNRSWLFTQNGTNDWGPNNGSGLAVYLWNINGTTAGDDYLFTPCFDLQAGHIYRLQFSYAVAADNSGVFPESFEIGFSQDQSSDDFTVLNEDWIFLESDNVYPAYETTIFEFTANVSTPQSIGFHVFSPADRYALQIDDINLQDLGLSTLTSEIPVIERVILSPNPTAGEVFLTLEWLAPRQDLRVKIINTLGEVTGEMALGDSYELKYRLDLQDHAPGIYFVQIEARGYSQTERIVVAR
jgi:hypothetical protein